MNSAAIFRMQNHIQHYAWGSTDGIATRIGLQNPDQKPYAEYWMGAHPAAPSELYSIHAQPIDGHPLDTLIAAQPTHYLGEVSQRHFGNRLPFLFKMLSAAKALSIQAHPNLTQARIGFEREEQLGIAIKAPTRSYRDSSHKPEMVYALTTYWAMGGFRNPSEIVAELGHSSLQTFAPIIQARRALAKGEAGLSSFLQILLEMKASQKKAVLAAIQQLAHILSPSVSLTALETHTDLQSARYWWVGELLRQFPNDAGALAPLYLNLIKLAPRHALFLGAGMLHAYLHGTALEVMANSDNVLRGGLTAKHIDRAELMQILDFHSCAPQWITPHSTGALHRFVTAAEEFELSHLMLSEHPYQMECSASPEIVLALGGQATIEVAGQSVLLHSGQSLFICPQISELQVHGSGELFRVGIAGRLFHSQTL